MAPRAHTAEEVRAMFIEQVQTLSRYWATMPGNKTPQDRCDGLAFSILNILDGTSGGFPCAINMVLEPHANDKKFHQENGDNWCEPGMIINNCMLHEQYYK